MDELHSNENSWNARTQVTGVKPFHLLRPSTDRGSLVHSNQVMQLNLNFWIYEIFSPRHQLETLTHLSFIICLGEQRLPRRKFVLRALTIFTSSYYSRAVAKYPTASLTVPYSINNMKILAFPVAYLRVSSVISNLFWAVCEHLNFRSISWP